VTHAVDKQLVAQGPLHLESEVLVEPHVAQLRIALRRIVVEKRDAADRDAVGKGDHAEQGALVGGTKDSLRTTPVLPGRHQLIAGLEAQVVTAHQSPRPVVPKSVRGGSVKPMIEMGEQRNIT